jgi:hypothetical protein
MDSAEKTSKFGVNKFVEQKENGDPVVLYKHILVINYSWHGWPFLPDMVV